MGPQFLKITRGFVFGFAWTFAITGLGVKLWSLVFFLLVLPACIIFETIEIIFFREKEEERSR